jgi:hypothetical protein
MKMNGKSQNCQLKSTRLNTVLSQDSFRGEPKRVTACSFCSALRYQAARCAGKSGMKTQPSSYHKSASLLFLIVRFKLEEHTE